MTGDQIVQGGLILCARRVFPTMFVVFCKQLGRHATKSPRLCAVRSSFGTSVKRLQDPPLPSADAWQANRVASLSEGLDDQPLDVLEGDRTQDWKRSFHGLSQQPFDKQVADVLLAPLPSDDVEIKPGRHWGTRLDD